MKKVFSLMLAIALAAMLAACGSSKATDEVKDKTVSGAATEPGNNPGNQASNQAVSEPAKQIIDFGDAESFEAALNNGDNLEGKIVSFTAGEYHPNSKLGYNVWAGEHLNFVSGENPDIKEGDTVTVRIDKVENLLGSWVITYEKVDAVPGDSTVTAKSLGSLAQKEEEQPLELTETGCHMDPPSSYSDDVFIHFCGMVHNPNKTLKAEFPEVIVTVKDGEGSILGTGNQMGFTVMPEDTVTLVGMISIPVSGISEDSQLYFDVDWSDFVSASKSPDAKTTDFTIDNISERSGDRNYITGEVTNNYDEEQTVNLSMILRKDGEIVFVDNTFVDGCKPGKPKAFEFERYEEWPKHDKIEMSAQPW